jgi:hypothetical protein
MPARQCIEQLHQRRGRHHLEAMKRLGETRIDYLIFDSENNARLWEICAHISSAPADSIDCKST